MKKILLLVLLFLTNSLSAQNSNSTETYSYKKGDPNGTSKWYMGREIAHVMGFEGMGWLNRPEREAEENS